MVINLDAGSLDLISEFAGIAQLVERNLAKVEVAGSNPVSRSSPFAASTLSPLRKPKKSALMHGWVAEWLCSGLQSRVRRFNSDPSLHLIDSAHFCGGNSSVGRAQPSQG